MAIKALVFDAYGTLYDIQSVAAVTEDAYPGYGDVITQIWRMKQLEYTWLRSLMRRYEDFSSVTRASLSYTLTLLGRRIDDAVFETIMQKYEHLDPYPDTLSTLAALKGRERAILSNGSPQMLRNLVHNTGLAAHLSATISVDAAGTFKPSPEAYALVEAELGIAPADILFVSSNPFDVSGAKAFGFQVAWIDRVSRENMAKACGAPASLPPLTMYQAIRTQMDELGFTADFRISSLSDLPRIIAVHG